MRKIVFILLLLFCLINCKKSKERYGANTTPIVNVDYTNYYISVYEADSLYIKGEYLKSYEILDKLFKKHEPINMQIYYEYVTYLSSSFKIGKRESICEKLKILVKRYGYTKERIKNSEELNEIFDNCEDVKNEIDNIYGDYLSKINLELRNEILEMTREDQKYRGNGDYKQNINKQNEIDFKNSRRLIEIFDTYGYPNEKVIGNYFIDKKHVNIGTILLHTKDSIRIKYFIPKLLEYVKLGHCNPKTYARLIDQLNLYNGENQVYGTYSNATVSIKKIDSLRKSIGLPKINYEKRRLKILYPNLNIK